MRVLVDSSVFIGFFGGRETVQVARLEECFRNGDEICYCGFILAEVLQGIRDAKQFTATKRQFENLIYLEDNRSTFELGATIYRELTKLGARPDVARSVAANSRCWWRNSRMALNYVLTIGYFDRLGMPRLS